ncbi:RING finger Dorfin [Fusarium mexicanum]|uniref:RING finger Dorfin n=1 Tax=Fusarium mexicanum TaxID=751941 RepID=A0A8H5I9L1_9HYPO|nr:RING finger Dorfin [Fusarium mexicanum]
MLCFRRNKGYKVVPKKKKVKATTSTSTSTNQTSTPRTRNGTGTGSAPQRRNKSTAKKTHPLPDRYSDSRPSPSQKRNPEQRPPIQPPRQQSKFTRTNDMSAQNSSFYGRVNPAITRGFEDDSSATAVQNRMNKPQEPSSSNTAQSQAYDTTPVPSTQAHFRYHRPSFLGDVDFTAESRRDIVVAHGITSALSPRQGYRPTPTPISNFANFDLENTDTKISDIRHDSISSHEQTITSIVAAASASSSSSAGPYLDQPESPDSDAVTASAIGSRECLACSDMKAPNSFPDFVTSKCTHTPSICLDCMVRSIQVAMKTEYWNEISCDECKEKLQYNDIRRFADEQTIAKYERQALRAAVADEENFFWCTSDCGSGQIHDSGSTQPIVVCIKCNHRSCFRHGVNWHEDLSCEEYDRLQDDPEFRSYLELENERWEEAQAAQEAQEEADRDVARRLAAEEIAETERQEAQARRAREREREREIERHREQERERETQQRQRERAHERQSNEERQREQKRERQEIQRERERRNQERQRQLEQERHQRQRQLEQQNQKRQRERERQRDQERQRQVERERQRNQEKQRQLEQERHQRQRALRETASSRNAAEERRKIAARKREEESRSYATMRATSKPCGGCGWAIERSFGW